MGPEMRPSIYLQTMVSILTLHCSDVVARLVNVTVDDQDPQLAYAPAENHWLSFVDHDCQRGCSAKPDAAQAYNHSWHDATYDFNVTSQNAPQTIAFQFTGSAIYVYGIVMSSKETDLLFFMDHDPSGNFTYQSSGSQTAYRYNVLYYANSLLRSGTHYLLLQNGQGDGGNRSLVLFDYLIYTT
ncbi:hypothetical protein PHLGIDRAFT_379487 [Phlebiopsis gigantea 11061_1 CR5-6]|uniref:Uncharacterized protein n=1 Tax=Phlebiopsis gigantea (strain 11061_1 CR5-6) TaxID=745531 RepID=A0A0C3RYF8_PHLG1|nr:hypothetical protein PHLGIDRAFT_379487 [Phlebiopsis gigantea 11061_1 CR5-6]